MQPDPVEAAQQRQELARMIRDENGHALGGGAVAREAVSLALERGREAGASLDLAVTRGIAPGRNEQYVTAFCAQVNPGACPVIVGVQPQLPVLANECFANAQRHAARWGGEVVHGWAIWEIPRLMIEAEFHTVWRTPGGTLLDVNPRPK